SCRRQPLVQQKIFLFLYLECSPWRRSRTLDWLGEDSRLGDLSISR
ncbi:unnamed protein product, partial [Amoebophrya sp. A25]